MTTPTPEQVAAAVLANRVLDEPYRDPDDDMSMLSRQLLRRIEALEATRSALTEANEAIRDAHLIIGYVPINQRRKWLALPAVQRAMEARL